MSSNSTLNCFSHSILNPTNSTLPSNTPNQNYSKPLINSLLSGCTSNLTYKKPQLMFKRPLDNYPNSAEFPPLPQQQTEGNKNVHTKKDTPQQSPFSSQINNLGIEIQKFYNFRNLKTISQISFEASYIHTLDLFKKCVSDLQSQTEIIVDAKDHTFRSFQGFICFITIAIFGRIYIIDAISLRDKIGMLNEVFQNRNILKVFYNFGESNCLVKLQRDFGIWMVNSLCLNELIGCMGKNGVLPSHLFKPTSSNLHSNTFIFSELVEYLENSHSKSNSKYNCSTGEGKDQINYDWRIRPIINDWFPYFQKRACELYFMVDSLKQLVPPKLTEEAFENSKKYSLEIYEVPKFEDELKRFHDKFPLHQNVSLSLSQRHLLYYLLYFRDEIGRKEDESTQYVLPDYLVSNILISKLSECEILCQNSGLPLVLTNIQQIMNLVSKYKPQEETSQRNSPSSNLQDQCRTIGMASNSKSKERTTSNVHFSARSYNQSILKTPNRQYKNILTKNILTPSIWSDSSKSSSGSSGAKIKTTSRLRDLTSPPNTFTIPEESPANEFDKEIKTKNFKNLRKGKRTQLREVYLNIINVAHKSTDPVSQSEYKKILHHKILDNPSSKQNPNKQNHQNLIYQKGTIHVPHSLKEIFKISNTNRKKNKQKKKEKISKIKNEGCDNLIKEIFKSIHFSPSKINKDKGKENVPAYIKKSLNLHRIQSNDNHYNPRNKFQQMNILKEIGWFPNPNTSSLKGASSYNSIRQNSWNTFSKNEISNSDCFNYSKPKNSFYQNNNALQYGTSGGKAITPTPKGTTGEYMKRYSHTYLNGPNCLGQH